MKVNNTIIFSYATPKNKKLNSYVGAVFYNSELESFTAVIFQSQPSRNKKLSRPILKDNQLTSSTIQIE